MCKLCRNLGSTDLYIFLVSFRQIYHWKWRSIGKSSRAFSHKKGFTLGELGPGTALPSCAAPRKVLEKHWARIHGFPGPYCHVNNANMAEASLLTTYPTASYQTHDEGHGYCQLSEPPQHLSHSLEQGSVTWSCQRNLPGRPLVDDVGPWIQYMFEQACGVIKFTIAWQWSFIYKLHLYIYITRCIKVGTVLFSSLEFHSMKSFR